MDNSQKNQDDYQWTIKFRTDLFENDILNTFLPEEALLNNETLSEYVKETLLKEAYGREHESLDKEMNEIYTDYESVRPSLRFMELCEGDLFEDDDVPF